MKKVLLKDLLFNKEKVEKMASELSEAFFMLRNDASQVQDADRSSQASKATSTSQEQLAFNEKQFVQSVITKFPELELKERITWITECLHNALPKSFEQAIAIILKALPEPCDPTLTDNDFGDFIYAPYGQYVATYGLTHVELSLNAIEALTTRFSCEDSIRTFINLAPDETLKKLKAWTKHPHYHVRRLVSEGTRPKLPWSKNIQYSNKYTDLLDALYSDKTRYVTRSVANHLNDISKTQPDVVFEKLTSWQSNGNGSKNLTKNSTDATLSKNSVDANLTKNRDNATSSELNFIIKHSLRTLIKNGHPMALNMLGFNNTIDANIQLNLDKNQVKIGDSVTFIITIHAHKNEAVLLDYVMTFQTKNGESQKVFKLKTMELKKGQIYNIPKTYTFKKGMTTRSFYPGQHAISIQANGKVVVTEPFELIN